MTVLLWLHEDVIRLPDDFAKNEDTRAVFIWDEDFLTRSFYGLKRRVFLYECLVELPIEIIAGSRQTILSEVLTQADSLLTWQAQDPETSKLIDALCGKYAVQVMQPEPFLAPISDRPEPAARRFFKYWKQSSARALTRDGKQPT